MDLKRKGSFYKVTLTVMDSGSAELEIWPPKIFHNFAGTMGKELISERNKNDEELSLCPVCFPLSPANNQI